MDKKIAGLLGAVAALSTLGAAQATPAPGPSDALTANSYADLLATDPECGKNAAGAWMSRRRPSPRKEMCSWLKCTTITTTTAICGVARSS